MGLSATLGVLHCPACGKMLHYMGMDFVPIYETKCQNCGKEWQVIKHQDGRTEVKPRTLN